MNKYVKYEVLEAPSSPTEYGTHIFTTPVYEQAVDGVRKAKEQGKIYFIKGIKEDGTKVVLL